MKLFNVCFIFLTLTCCLQAIPHQEVIRETTGPLLFFLEQQANNKECSYLNSEDIECLWSRLYSFSEQLHSNSERSHLDQAYNSYQYGLNTNGGERLQQMIQAYLHLLPLWCTRSDCPIDEAVQNFSKEIGIIEATTHKSFYNNFKTNPYTTKKYKKTIRPFLMDSKHPIKKSLDEIFINSRVTADLHTFESAGFETILTNLRSFISVGRHQKLPGYLVKVSLDNELNQKMNTPSWIWFARRCELSQKITAVIKSQKCHHFTVAKKWIYPLPVKPEVPSGEQSQRKNEILVVTDMHLVSKSETEEAWFNMTAKHLKQLYTIITYAGGSSYRPDNIPLTKSGKFAFIDTEYPHKTPDYETVLLFLSPEMQEYWKKLVRKGGLVYY